MPEGNSNTLVRSLHDVGLAAWFGGSLMGAVGLNGATSDIGDARERGLLAADGWARWAPVNAAAIGAYAIGGIGLIAANRDRVADQPDTRRNTAIKTLLSGAAIAVTAWSGALGKKVSEGGLTPTAGATEPTPETESGVAAAQRQLKAAQWVIPALTGALIVLASAQGEQQKPAQQRLARAKAAVGLD